MFDLMSDAKKRAEKRPTYTRYKFTSKPNNKFDPINVESPSTRPPEYYILIF